MSCEIKEHQVGAVTLIEVGGPLVLGEGSHALEEKLQRLIVGGHRALLLECSQVHTIDGSAIGALARCFISLDRRGGKLKLLNVPPAMRTALELLGVIKAIESFDNQVTALASFK